MVNFESEEKIKNQETSKTYRYKITILIYILHIISKNLVLQILYIKMPKSQS